MESQSPETSPNASEAPSEAPAELSAEASGPLALISDIHGNLEALSSVLAEIRRRGITRIACLGDVIGYGPNPRECLDLVMANCEFCLMGNHDFAAIYEPLNFNAAAENAAYWTRWQLEGEPNEDLRYRRWKQLTALPTRVVQKRFMAVHGSPRRPINEYIFPDDVYNSPNKIQALFDRMVSPICFVGHTHVPGVFIPEPEFLSPMDLDQKYKISPQQRAIINVGSVGQPRDRNPLSSFAILHEDHVEFVRLAYDLQTTVAKIQAITDLDNYLGTRLLEGR